MTTDEKGVFVQVQITISWKALVLAFCLNTLVHDLQFVGKQMDCGINFVKSLHILVTLALQINLVVWKQLKEQPKKFS